MHANQGIVLPKKLSYCKDHAIQGFINQEIAVYLLKKYAPKKATNRG